MRGKCRKRRRNDSFTRLMSQKINDFCTFFVPASLVLLILKFRTLLEISFLEEIKLETEHGQDSTDRRTVEFLKTRIFFTFIYNYLIIS